MTVAELIAELQKLPSEVQNLPVVGAEHCCSGDKNEVDIGKVEENAYWSNYVDGQFVNKQGKCLRLY